jgi:hypothetical protein
MTFQRCPASGLNASSKNATKWINLLQSINSWYYLFSHSSPKPLELSFSNKKSGETQMAKVDFAIAIGGEAGQGTSIWQDLPDNWAI